MSVDVFPNVQVIEEITIDGKDFMRCYQITQADIDYAREQGLSTIHIKANQYVDVELEK